MIRDRDETTASGLVWYVAYGSNLSSVRLQRYLDQCDPVEPPRDRRPMILPNRLFFASFSTLWGGGCAFIDPAACEGEQTRVTAWLLRRDQFVGILARENGVADVALSFDPGSLAPGDTVVAVDGRYGLVLSCPSPDDRPALTFTTPDPTRLDETAPSASYLRTIEQGLAEGHGLPAVDAHAYLASRSVGRSD